jgi:hypothetical protein
VSRVPASSSRPSANSNLGYNVRTWSVHRRAAVSPGHAGHHSPGDHQRHGRRGGRHAGSPAASLWAPQVGAGREASIPPPRLVPTHRPMGRRLSQGSRGGVPGQRRRAEPVMRWPSSCRPPPPPPRTPRPQRPWPTRGPQPRPATASWPRPTTRSRRQRLRRLQKVCGPAPPASGQGQDSSSCSASSSAA